MISFLLCLAILIVGYFASYVPYGKISRSEEISCIF